MTYHDFTAKKQGPFSFKNISFMVSLFDKTQQQPNPKQFDKIKIIDCSQGA